MLLRRELRLALGRVAFSDSAGFPGVFSVLCCWWWWCCWRVSRTAGDGRILCEEIAGAGEMVSKGSGDSRGSATGVVAGVS